MLTKKELKTLVEEKAEVQDVRVKRSFVYVCLVFYFPENERVYEAFDFAKWHTEDQTIVGKAKHLLKQTTNGQSKYFNHPFKEKMINYAIQLIHSLNWNEERGVAIARGRAVADIVRQILVDQKKFNAELISANEPERRMGVFSEDEVAEVLSQRLYARSKVNPGEMIKGTS